MTRHLEKLQHLRISFEYLELRARIVLLRIEEKNLVERNTCFIEPV